MPVTLKDLASELAITEASVSMALRNHPRISETTRLRVQDLARTRGYIVNPAFSRRGAVRNSKRARPLMPLGFLLERNPSYAHGSEAYIQEFTTIAARYGYAINPQRVSSKNHPDRLGTIFKNRGIEAVIIGPLFSNRMLMEFPWSDFSLAGCMAGHFTPPCHLVMPDVGDAIMQARQQCIDRGYIRIGLAQISESTVPVDYLDRYGTSTLASSTCPDGVLFKSMDFTGTDIRKFVDWVTSNNFDCVIGQTAVFYWWLLEGGFDIPRSIGYVDLRMDAHRTERELSGFEEDHLHMADLACQLVDMEVRQFRRGPPKAPARMLVKLPWFEGSTVKSRA